MSMAWKHICGDERRPGKRWRWRHFSLPREVRRRWPRVTHDARDITAQHFLGLLPDGENGYLALFD